MFEETKKAVRKTIQVAKILFTMDPKEYNRLIEATSSITFPTEEDIYKRISTGMSRNEVIIAELKERYVRKAVEKGFTPKQGIAMLEYVALLEEAK